MLELVQSRGKKLPQVLGLDFRSDIEQMRLTVFELD